MERKEKEVRRHFLTDFVGVFGQVMLRVSWQGWRVLAEAVDLLAGVGGAAHGEVGCDPRHFHDGVLPDFPRNGYFSRVASR